MAWNCADDDDDGDGRVRQQRHDETGRRHRQTSLGDPCAGRKKGTEGSLGLKCQVEGGWVARRCCTPYETKRNSSKSGRIEFGEVWWWGTNGRRETSRKPWPPLCRLQQRVARARLGRLESSSEELTAADDDDMRCSCMFMQCRGGSK